MQPLATVLDSLRAEIASALAARTPLPPGVHLKPKRVVLSLGVQLLEDASGRSQLRVTTIPLPSRDSAHPSSAPTTPAGSPHTLTIEFAADPEPGDGVGERAFPASLPQLQSEPRAGGRALDATAESTLVESLGKLVGNPGFDSSARATVFREALEGLSAAEIRQVVQALQVRNPGPLEPPIKRACHFIGAVLRSGPLRSAEQGGRHLEELLQSWEAQTLLGLLQSRWKSQQDWLEIPATPEPPVPPAG